MNGCSNVTRELYCDKHVHKVAEEESNRQKRYDQVSRDSTSNSFYQSKEWKKLRAFVRHRDKGLCQHCKRDNRIKKADVVHHIVEIKEDWSKRLDPSNLECVCHTCHNKEHGRRKGK